MVLPSSVGGAKSASKYLTRIMAGLRAGLPDEDTSTAIKTLELLLKAWQKTRGEQALNLLRKNKISWGALQLAGSPTQIKKGKKGKPDQTVIVSPSKPSTSPWLSVQERVKISKLLSEKWSFSDDLRKEWIVLTPVEQHKQYNSFVTRLKDGYTEMSRISNSVHAKLGHRKNWIFKAVTQAGLMPKSKKDKEDNFKISSIFFSSVKLSNLGLSIKKAFSPSEYLESIDSSARGTFNACIGIDTDNEVIVSDFSLEKHGPAYELWQIWAEKFVPVFPAKINIIPDAAGLPDDNPYVLLDTTVKSVPKEVKPIIAQSVTDLLQKLAKESSTAPSGEQL
jgi:hypothetical protein